MTKTTVDHEFATDLLTTYRAALPLSESCRLADPTLIEQYQALLGWPAKLAKWRAMSWDERYGKKPPTAPLYNGRGIGSDQFLERATRAAEGDLWRDARARLDDGRVALLAYQPPRRLGDGVSSPLRWRQRVGDVAPPGTCCLPGGAHLSAGRDRGSFRAVKRNKGRLRVFRR